MTTDNWINLIAAIIVGVGTLFLGIMAWRTIRQTRSIQKSEKRERLLKEIIEWAVDVGSPKYALNIDVLTSGGISEDDKLTASSLKQAYHLDMLMQKGDYLAKISPIFTKGLEKAVEEVMVVLKEHQEIINSFIDAKIDAKAVGEHDFLLTKTASKVMEEAAKIKTKDIG